MTSFVNKIWFFIILFGVYEGFIAYEDHSEKLEMLKQQIPSLKKQYSIKEKEFKQMNNYLNDIEEAKKKIDLVALEVEKITKKLPDSINDAQNLGDIKRYTEQLNIKSIFLSPLEEESRGFYFVKKYELTGTGTYLQFLILLERIATSDILLNITSLEFKRSDKKQRSHFQIINSKIIVEAYRYNPNHKESREIETKTKTETETNKGAKGS